MGTRKRLPCKRNRESYINQGLYKEGTFYVLDVTAWSRDLRVTADGDCRVAGRHGAASDARRSGWFDRISVAGVRAAWFVPVHDRGRVLVDAATLHADVNAATEA